MKVTLPPELEELVKQKVADGEYASTNEVIHEALELLREHDALKQYRLEELRREIAIGAEEYGARDVQRAFAEETAS